MRNHLEWLVPLFAVLIVFGAICYFATDRPSPSQALLAERQAVAEARENAREQLARAKESAAFQIGRAMESGCIASGDWKSDWCMAAHLPADEALAWWKAHKLEPLRKAKP